MSLQVALWVGSCLLCSLSCKASENLGPGKEFDVDEEWKTVDPESVAYSLDSSLWTVGAVLLGAVVGTALYWGRNTSLWRMNRDRFREPGEPTADSAQLQVQLAKLEKQRDDLRAALEHKVLDHKAAETNLNTKQRNARDEVDNDVERKQPAVNYASGEHRARSPSVTSLQSCPNDTSTRPISHVKLPSLSSTVQTRDSISQPKKFTGEVFSHSDYTRRCRTLISKLRDSEKTVTLLQEELESTKKMREEYVSIVEQTSVLGRKINVLTREKKEMAKHVTALQNDIKTIQAQYEEVKKHHVMLVKHFDQLNNSAKLMARDKRLLTRQMVEAKEEVESVRSKLESIHQEKMQLLEHIEKIESSTQISQQSSGAKSSNFGWEVENKFPTTLGTDRRMSTEGERGKIEPVHGAKKSQLKRVPFTSGAKIVQKPAKTLEEKYEEFEKQNSFLQELPDTKPKGAREEVRAPPPTAVAKNKGALEKLKTKTRGEILTETKTDPPTAGLQEFARSLQKLERNVEINMRVRDMNKDKPSTLEPITELFHKEVEPWDSSTDIAPRNPIRATVSDTNGDRWKRKQPSETNIFQAMESTTQAQFQAVSDHSSCSILCMDSECSVCTRVDCPLDHESCSEPDCLATCSSCSLHVELSQSIASSDHLVHDDKLGLADMFGSGPTGEGDPWNLPGLNGILTRSTRPTGSVLACQGSSGEVGRAASDDYTEDKPANPEPVQPEVGQKHLSRFTANEDGGRRAPSHSPAFRHFLEELTNLAKGVAEMAPPELGVNVQVMQVKEQTGPLTDETVPEATKSGSNDNLDRASHTSSGNWGNPEFAESTLYFVNNETEPIF